MRALLAVAIFLVANLVAATGFGAIGALLMGELVLAVALAGAAVVLAVAMMAMHERY